MSESHDRTRVLEAEADLDAVEFEKASGLVPVVVQDVVTDGVLMVAWANRRALARTLETGRMHYWSRSRRELWKKGETSGNVQRLVSLHLDCDGDTVLARVEPEGPACHTGRTSCFGVEGSFLATLWRVLRSRAEERPEDSYTVRLLDDENLRTKKLGEETAELVAALSRDDGDAAREEAADLLYHVLAALLAQGVELADLDETLRRRHGPWP